MRNMRQKKKELQQQYEEETERSTEIDDLETYMKSSQYIEDGGKKQAWTDL